jgi:uncharacterized protein YegP (UPF0339 family)
MAGKFELFKDARRVPVPQGSQHGDHRQQRGLQVEDAAENGIKSVQTNAPGAAVVDKPGSAVNFRSARRRSSSCASATSIDGRGLRSRQRLPSWVGVLPQLPTRVILPRAEVVDRVRE